MATCCPGLEDWLRGEIEENLACPAQIERGKAYFAADPGVAAQRLRCADNLYIRLGDLRIGPTKADLPAIRGDMEKLRVGERLRALQRESAIPAGDTIHVSCSRAGKHSFSRFAAAQAAEAGVRGFASGDAHAHDIGLRLDILGDRGRVSVKVTPADYRFRGQREFSRAALRPTIAHAMVRCAGVGPQEVCLDPFCGSGTILTERAAYPFGALLGGDIREEAVRIARENVEALVGRGMCGAAGDGIGDAYREASGDEDGDAHGVGLRDANADGSINASEAARPVDSSSHTQIPSRIRIECWDATKLPLPDASIDAILTNPPWGGQIAVADLPELYRAFAAEARRVLRPGGRIVVLTDQPEAWRCASLGAGLDFSVANTVSLHGTICSLCRGTRPETDTNDRGIEKGMQ